jgi:hypothetical protein
MNLLALVPLAWWFVNFEPLQALIDYLFKYKPHSTIAIHIHSALGCIKCVAFWLTIICTFDFILACQAALLAYILDECLQKLR